MGFELIDTLFSFVKDEDVRRGIAFAILTGMCKDRSICGFDSFLFLFFLKKN